MVRLEAAFREKEDLIMVGAYQKGSDPYVDAAVALRERILSFLQQRPDEISTASATNGTLMGIGAQIESMIGRAA
jgi:flagellar biosynthesis/type III secretory pathway ATPase